MKKLMLISLLCLIGTIAVFAQNNDQIVLIKKHYFLNDKQLNSKDLKALLKSDQASAVVYKKSTTNTTIGTVMTVVAAGFIIYAVANPPSEKAGPLPGLIDDAEMSKHMTPLYIGLGFVAVGVPFFLSGSKLFKKSITIYNSKLTTGYNGNIKLDLGFTRTGVGIVGRF